MKSAFMKRIFKHKNHTVEIIPYKKGEFVRVRILSPRGKVLFKTNLQTDYYEADDWQKARDDAYSYIDGQRYVINPALAATIVDWFNE
jgi:hypothetical protein